MHEYIPENNTLSDLADFDNMSEYKEVAVSYLTGFIVKKMKEKLTCIPCLQALTSDQSVHQFMAFKNKGGLQLS